MPDGQTVSNEIDTDQLEAIADELDSLADRFDQLRERLRQTADDIGIPNGGTRLVTAHLLFGGIYQPAWSMRKAAYEVRRFLGEERTG